MCLGDEGQLYSFRSFSGIKSTSWKTKHLKSSNFSASLKPMLNSLALLKGASPICKEENLRATALYYMAGFESLQGEASPVLPIW